MCWIWFVSFHGILVSDELICHDCWTNDVIWMKLGRIHLCEVPHPWIASFVQKLWHISSSATRMPWNETFCLILGPLHSQEGSRHPWVLNWSRLGYGQISIETATHSLMAICSNGHIGAIGILLVNHMILLIIIIIYYFAAKLAPTAWSHVSSGEQLNYHHWLKHII